MSRKILFLELKIIKHFNTTTCIAVTWYWLNDKEKGFFSELCRGKAMVADTMPQQRKIEESERLRGERDQIKFIDLRFERWQVVGLSELRWGKVMVAYTNPQQRKKKETKG